MGIENPEVKKRFNPELEPFLNNGDSEVVNGQENKNNTKEESEDDSTLSTLGDDNQNIGNNK